MKSLQGQIAIVTGGGRGIGKATATLFQEEGAQVIVWDVHPSSESLATHLRDQEISYQEVDVRDAGKIARSTAEVIERFGKIDILINNAGITQDRTFLKMSEETWKKVIDVNLHGIFNVTQAILPVMKSAGYGRIISASSINGFLGAFGQTNYAASKAALVGFSKSLAKEVGKYGITVNVVAPGFVATDMTDQMPKHVLDQAIAQIPVGRVGTTYDIAHAYLYLASKNAGFVNGSVLHVNGGVF